MDIQPGQAYHFPSLIDQVIAAAREQDDRKVAVVRQDLIDLFLHMNGELDWLRSGKEALDTILLGVRNGETPKHLVTPAEQPNHHHVFKLTYMGEVEGLKRPEEVPSNE